MLIDCDTCAVRDLQCGECVMTVLLQVDAPGQATGQVSGLVEVDEAQARALEVLAVGGLVPHLRLIPLTPGPQAASA